MGNEARTDVQFSAEVDPRDGTPVVHVRGELDTTNARELKETLLRLVGHGQRRLILDVRGVPYMDSGAVGVLAGIHHVLQERQGGITLIAPTRRVFRILCITGMDRTFYVQEVQTAA